MLIASKLCPHSCRIFFPRYHKTIPILSKTLMPLYFPPLKVQCCYLNSINIRCCINFEMILNLQDQIIKIIAIKSWEIQASLLFPLLPQFMSTSNNSFISSGCCLRHSFGLRKAKLANQLFKIFH